MNAADLRPPKKEAGRHDSRPATDTFHKAHTTSHHTGGAAPFYRYVEGLRRRRAAANLLPPSACGRRDPWWYEPPGERGYEQAAFHLLDRGLLPAADCDGLRGMHRSGGASRKAALSIAQAWELVA